MHELGHESLEPGSLPEIVVAAARRAPLVSPVASWTYDELTHALALRSAESDDAWVQLGAVLEAIEIALGPVGSAVARATLGDPRLVPLSIGPANSLLRAERLATCLERSVIPFRTPPSRVAAHVSARLSAAAAAHASSLHWIDSPLMFGDLAELVLLADREAIVPPGASAVGIIQIPTSDVPSLVDGGRAACHAWLEAVSLGLAVQAASPLSWRSLEGRPDATSIMRRYRRLVPDEPAGCDAAMLWFGLAAPN